MRQVLTCTTYILLLSYFHYIVDRWQMMVIVQSIPHKIMYIPCTRKSMKTYQENRSRAVFMVPFLLYVYMYTTMPVTFLCKLPSASTMERREVWRKRDSFSRCHPKNDLCCFWAPRNFPLVILGFEDCQRWQTCRLLTKIYNGVLPSISPRKIGLVSSAC